MSKESSGETLREYGKRKKRSRRRKGIIIFTLFAAIAFAAVIYLYKMYHRTYKNYEVIKSVLNETDKKADYIEYGGAVVRYDQNGAIAIDKNTEILWNGSYEMTDPIADVCKDYVVVADRGDKLVHIFNKKGSVGSFQTEYKIRKVEVAEQGVVAALMSHEDISIIKLYSKDGTILSEKESSVEVDGYPVDFSLSEDGEKLAIVYVSINKGRLLSSILFYNFGEVGQNYTNRFAGGFVYEEVVIPRIAFLNNDTVCAFSENGFILYNMPETPEIIMNQDVEKEIKSILYSNKYIGLVLKGDSDLESKLQLYDLKGKQILSKELNIKYNKIYITDEEIIAFDNLSCLIMKTSGQIKFQYSFSTNIVALYPANHLDRYLFIGEKELYEIKLLE